MSPCIWYIYVRVWGAIDSATQAAAESSLTFPPDISIVSLVASHVFPCDARTLREEKQKDTFIKSACASIIVNNSQWILQWASYLDMKQICVVWSNWSLLCMNSILRRVASCENGSNSFTASWSPPYSHPFTCHELGIPRPWAKVLFLEGKN